MNKKYLFGEVETDEFDECQCGHKKIAHGGLHKIVPFGNSFMANELIVQFGCIECEHDQKIGSQKCMSYTPKWMRPIETK
jgi:hypothetical protein